MTVKQKEDLLTVLQNDLDRGMELTPDEVLVWDCVCAITSVRNQSIRTVVNGMKGGIAPRKYREIVAFIMEYMVSGCGRRLSRVEKVHLLPIIFQSVKARMSWTITPKTLLDNYKSIPVAMEVDYPSYADSELLDWLIKTAA
jgi:hypothetical protein